MFAVPDSSDPPSTPDSRRSSRQIPSTTPAGPPPSSFIHPSTTPAGPPPPSIFGSSQFGPGSSQTRPAFAPTGRLASGSLQRPSKGGFLSQFGESQNSSYNASTQNRGGFNFGVLASSPPQRSGYGLDDDDEEDDEEDEDMNDEDNVDQLQSQEDENMNDDEDHLESPSRPPRRGPADSTRLQSNESSRHRRFDAENGPRALSRSQNSDFVDSLRSSRRTNMPQLQTKYDFLGIAKGLSASSKPPTLSEPDEFILSTERHLERLSDSQESDDNVERTRILSDVAKELGQLWDHEGTSRSFSSRGIGPTEQESGVAKSNYLASLLLRLHHQPATASHLDLSSSRFGRSSVFSFTSNSGTLSKPTPTPKVLLDWMNTFHNPAPMDTDEVLKLRGDYSKSPRFWDGVLASAFRGRFQDTITLLRGANFMVAETALTDGYNERGYSGPQLNNIEEATQVAVTVIESCPSVRANDWDVKGNDWAVFRHRVSEAITELRDLAEGESYDAPGKKTKPKGASKGKNKFSLSAASRRAESKVPWTIYENLTTLYELLRGNTNDLLQLANDWVEASIGLTAWWDGEGEDMPSVSLAASQQSLSRSLSRSQRVRSVDVSPAAAYRQRLATSLSRVIVADEDDTMDINSTSAIEVGLCCVFEGNVEGVLSIIQTWSLPIAVALSEVASAGNWLSESPAASKSIRKNLDKSDLMVLSYGQDQFEAFRKDDILLKYAIALSHKPVLRAKDGKISREGWQLAIQTLGRLDNAELANERIGNLLKRLDLDSPERVDAILALCNSLGFAEHAEATAERYADSLVALSSNYGDALLYYSRAHNTKKIREILGLLTSFSLVQSRSYPLDTSLDSRLRSFLESPKQTLTHISRTDLRAAQLLATHLSGYATLRRFYDLRDEEGRSQITSQKPTHRPKERRREAAKALIAAITSASESIRGGLYDPEAESVLQVDGLLVLLGETLPFLDQSTRTLDIAQINVILAAVEDLSTAPSLISAQCAECLAATLAAAHNSTTITASTEEPVPTPHDLLKKSISSLNTVTTGASGTMASSQFSLVGSSLLNADSADSAGSSAVLDRDTSHQKKQGRKDLVQRGWDWRAPFEKDLSAEKLIRVVRLALAKEIGRAWVGAGI